MSTPGSWQPEQPQQHPAQQQPVPPTQHTQPGYPQQPQQFGPPLVQPPAPQYQQPAQPVPPQPQYQQPGPQYQPQQQWQQQPTPPPVTAWQTLHLTTAKPKGAGYWPQIPVVVRIDGYEYRPGWGTSQYTIPADRPVRVQCSMAWLWEFGNAEIVIVPGQPPVLDYLAPAQQWSGGSLAPRGQAIVKGRAIQIVTYAVLGLVVVGLFATMFAALALDSAGYSSY